jgi:hypothetical protein
MCTVADFRTRFPEFADDTAFPDARVQMFLDDAALCIDQDRYGAMYDLAVCYLAAHELTLATRTASAPGGGASLAVGPTSSKTAGGVSVTKAINSIDLSDGDAYYQQTQYGLKFISIRDKVKIPGFTVIC